MRRLRLLRKLMLGRTSGASCVTRSLMQRPTTGIVFEFELPFEGGRRPDVVVLAGRSILVLEFKSSPIVDAAQIDQAGAYARDLAEYHEATHWRDVAAVLVATSFKGTRRNVGGVTICPPNELAEELTAKATTGTIDFDTWLSAPYAPLPSLVAAARRIFNHEPLPHIKRALALGIPEVVGLVDEIVAGAERNDRRRAVFVTGVPGAGKTLVGLRAVYERSNGKALSTFLSGNGPLVAVLQDALKSTVFVRDLHKFITSYGSSSRVPEQHVLVFDEAQRAWDSGYMFKQKGIAHSEPELLVAIAGRLAGWAALVGLVGTGQAIYSGEEGGLPLWREALATGADDWEIFCPPSIADHFSDLDVFVHPELELQVPLRARRGERLHQWVTAVLDGRLREADSEADALRKADYPIYVTRDLEEAKEYAEERYRNEPDRRFGLVASSHANNLEDHGVDNTWFATRRTNVAKWFNEPRRDSRSCCALTGPVTEFQCQGLELDLPIVCWGDDLLWSHNDWLLRPRRRRYPIEDPETLLRNTYRVLLTRGRDALIIWVPGDTRLDETARALEVAGATADWPAFA